MQGQIWSFYHPVPGQNTQGDSPQRSRSKNQLLTTASWNWITVWECMIILFVEWRWLETKSSLECWQILRIGNKFRTGLLLKWQDSCSWESKVNLLRHRSLRIYLIQSADNTIRDGRSITSSQVIKANVLRSRMSKRPINGQRSFMLYSAWDASDIYIEWIPRKHPVT